MIFSVLLYGFYRYKSLSMEEIWSEVIDEKISETIVNGRNNKSTNPNFKKWLKNSNFRNLFLEKLVSTENKFSGGAHQEIKQLFADYNLKQEALQKLKKKKRLSLMLKIFGKKTYLQRSSLLIQNLAAHLEK
jgi:hypothetical protein